MQLNRHEIINRRILDGARRRAAEATGEPNPKKMVLRTSRFVAILKTTPSLIQYAADYANSAPGWPRFKPTYGGVIDIELAEHAL